jgi:hypothetical protein
MGTKLRAFGSKQLLLLSGDIIAVCMSDAQSWFS